MNEKTIELLVERLVSRINKANEFFLIKIGESIKKIRELTSTQAQQLVQILKYGGNYEEIIQEISRLTNLNIKDIDAIFNEMAKKDYKFAEKFYKYRGIEYVPYNENKVLLRQVSALASITRQEMYNYARTTNLGYSIRDLQGNVKFVGLRETYNRVLDEAVLNVGTGVDTFDQSMTRIMKDIGGSGLKKIDYESGRSMRLDSAVRMHLHDGLRTLFNQNQELFGEEFNYNGIEVTHHQNSAPDHIDTIDGQQFVLVDKVQEQINNGIETEIKQEDIRDNQVRVNGKWYDDFNAVNNSLERQVSTLNCRHRVFSIVVGVSKPEYTQEQLDEDKQKNIDGFDLDGKHYSLYEGEQLQRSLERKIREQKDIQILAKASGNDELVLESQTKITQLTQKYKELSDVSGLPTRMERMRVTQYKRSSTKNIENKINSLYNYGNTEENFRIYKNAQKRQDKIKNGEYNLNINVEKQQKHNINSDKYVKGKSYFNIDIEEQQKMVNDYAGKGYIYADAKGNLTNKELCVTNKIIGKYINKNKNTEVETNSFVIHYAKDGVHIVPADYRKGDKNE